MEHQTEYNKAQQI